MPLWRAGGPAVAVLALSLLVLATAPAAAQRAADDTCTVVVAPRPIPGLREGSAVAHGRRMPARLFTFNDSGRAELLMLDPAGAITARVTVNEADVVDWEDVTVASCPAGSCVYIADIGDNQARREHITLYRVNEPRDGDRTVTAQRFDAIYPDAPHDAEAVFGAPDGRLYLITKQARGAELYAFPRQLSSDHTNRLEHVRRLAAPDERNGFERITDAETSADGRLVAVRSNDALFLLATDALIAGRLSEAAVYSLRRLGEPQGEGVAFTPDGDVVLVGEGAGRRDAGTFARVTCASPSR